MNATNTFQNGLITDSHPLATTNDALTNCLNGTLITYNGNELILQNDVGNSKILYGDKEVQLKSGYVPIGMKSYGGIIYIFSHNPNTGYGEIGTFPSPDYENSVKDDGSYQIHKLQYTYRPLHNLVHKVNDKYELFDLNTKKFNFDLEHPVQIDFQTSYDESINIIFNDGKNIPRLINTRFAPYGNNEVKIIHRDQKLLETNVYEEENFEYNVSLIRVCNSIVGIEFVGEQEDGNLAVGNYTFYFKVADSDDNESDFIGQSGQVVCHKGRLNDPFSIDGGVAAENSHKSVQFKLTKIPRQFTRVYVYYTRNSSTQNGTLTTEYKKITKYFEVSTTNDDGYRQADLNITGYDTTIDISLVDLNPLNNNPTSAQTQATKDNFLFLGNVKQSISLYEKLRKFSREYVKVEPAESETEEELLYDVYLDYTDDYGEDFKYDKYGYYNVKNIYNKVGYWPEEYYRFGIVYILDDYTTTPVFNIKGSVNGKINEYGVIQFKKQYFKQPESKNLDLYINDCHVLQFPKFTVNKKELPKGVIGCFFVRQKRIKNILGQALLIGTDQGYTHLPVLYGGDQIRWIAQSFIRDRYPYRYSTSTGTDSKVDTSGNSGANGRRPEQSKSQSTNNQGRSISMLKRSAGNTDVAAEFYDIGGEGTGGYSEGKYGTIQESECFFNHSLNLIKDLLEGKYYNGTKVSDEIYKSPRSHYLGNSWVTHCVDSIYNAKGRAVFNTTKNYSYIEKNAAIMPEFELKQELYSSIFTGGVFYIQAAAEFKTINALNTGLNAASGYRGSTTKDINTASLSHISPANPESILENREKYVNIISVLEQTVVKTIDGKVFKSVAGNAADPTQYETPFTDIRFSDIGKIYDQKDEYEALGASDDVGSSGNRKNFGGADYTHHTRGIFSPYLGIGGGTSGIGKGVTTEGADEVFDSYILINIKSGPLTDNQVSIREQDYSEYYPISDRIELNSDILEETFKCFRGDCYIGNFTHRMLRNFIDPEFPIQDKISQKYNWLLGNRIGFKYENSDHATNSYDNPIAGDKNQDITRHFKDSYLMNETTKHYLNRADVNAVPLGQWITFKFYSSLNPCMRSTDGSNALERTTFNYPRKFYPLYGISLQKNTYKLADSYVYNEGYEQSVGSQMYNLFPEVPAIKEEFSNRVMYSNINVDSLVTNGFRTFRSGAYQDYTRQYGKLIKLVPFDNAYHYLYLIFEHGVGYAQVNEKALATQLNSKAVYLETNKVLGDLTMCTEEYGSQWANSVITADTGIYGVDTTGKKIWKVAGVTWECISDLKVNKFLVDNLVTNEISNQVNVLTFDVKTHYNKHKNDIMFTFHRTLDNGKLIAWNLCYNEVTKKMTTFYSWLPLDSANIENTFYSIPFVPRMPTIFAKTGQIEKDQVLHLWQHNKTNNWCNWYGEQHPFEFEYVINQNPNFQKIFNNMQIIANKTVPESFHFEIVGESYDFAKDKKNMYHRQEATKSFYDWCMSRVLSEKMDFITYDEEAVNTYLSKDLEQNPKSAIFPLTVKRLDFNNTIYDIYKQLTSHSQDYQSLSGSEIVYDNTINEYLIDTHIKAIPKGGHTWQTVCRTDDENASKIATYYVNHGIEIRINGEYLQKKVMYDQRLSNCKYVEDCWKVQVPSINYFEKNEVWKTGKPPINIVTDPLPETLAQKSELPYDKEIAEKYPIETDSWTTKKQTKIRDKYIRVKIRYTGDDLAIISGIVNILKETYN